MTDDYSFAKYKETISIVELCEKLSILEINNASLYHIIDGWFSLRFPKWYLGTEEFLRGFADISKCWFDRIINQTIVEACLDKSEEDIRTRVENALTSKINKIYNVLDEFYNFFSTTAWHEGRADEIPSRTVEEIDIDDENGWWHTLGFTFVSLRECIDKLSPDSSLYVIADIMNSIDSTLDIIEHDIKEITELAYRAKFVNPLYYYELDSQRYLAIITNPSLLNETTIDSIYLKNTEILPFNDKPVEFIKSSKALGASYEVTQGMIRKYDTEYAETSYPEVRGFRTIASIPLTVYIIKDDVLMEASTNIPSSISLTRYTGDDITEDSRYYSVIGLLQSVYAQAGVIKTAKLSEIQVSETMLQNFDEELIEKPIDESTVYVTNKELLNDIYFSTLCTADEAFSIVNNNVYCNLSAIASVSVGRVEGEANNQLIISFANTNSLYMKDIMTYEGSLAVTTNQYILSQYDSKSAQIDNEYYIATQSENGLAERLGFSTLAIELPSERKYIIKTRNYSEEVFDGNVKLLTNIRIPGQSVPLTKGLTISKTLYSLIVQYLLNRNLIRIAEPALIIPSSISVYETNSSNIEAIINKGTLTNEIYSFDSETNVVRFSSNIKLTIPTNGKLYIFISSSEQPYVYGNGRYVLTFDRV